MNYSVPYFNMVPNVVAPTIGRSASKGLFSRLLGGLNWSSILNNTQKTLGIVNQAIPMVKQISPVVKNAKTMFKVMSEFKRIDSPVSSINTNRNEPDTEKKVIVENVIESKYDGGPTFFIN